MARHHEATAKRMNRADKRIAERIKRGGQLPTAYDPWDDADREVCGTIRTAPYDYTKKAGLVIFEQTEDTRLLAGEEMETGEGGVRSGGGLSPTLTAEMGGHGNNYVYVLQEDGDDPQGTDEGV